MREKYFRTMIIGILIILSAYLCFSTELLIFNDEQIHFLAGLYYQNHWIPPSLTSPEIAFTRSYNGTSYLEYLDIIYFFYGKAAAIGSLINISDWQSMRILNFLLLLGLCTYVLLSRFSSYLLITIGSAAVFYSFTYIGAEGITHLVAVLLVGAYFKQQSEAKDNSIQLGLLSGLLLCCKLTYLPLFFCIFFLLLSNKNINLKRYILIFTVIFTGRFSLNLINNDFNWFTKIDETHAKYADPYYGAYIPGTPSHWNIDLKNKGYSIPDMLYRHNWFSETFVSMLAYKYQAKKNFNMETDQVLIPSLLFIFLFYSIYKHGFNRNCLIPIFFMLLTIGLSLVRSWYFEYQPQGRYLFAILPLISIQAFHIFKNKIPDIYLLVNYLILIYCIKLAISINLI